MLTKDSLTCTCLSISGGSDPFCGPSLDLDRREESEQKSERMKKVLQLPLRHNLYLSAPMLPTIMTAPMMPMRLYLGNVLESCLRITMCMSSWGKEWRWWGGEQEQGGSVCVKLNLDVRPLLLLPEGQSAEEVEEFADLLKCQIVHVVQTSLHQMSVNQTEGTAHEYIYYLM